MFRVVIMMRCSDCELCLFERYVQLLEMLMNNIGENVHRQVIDTDLLALLVKIVKKKVTFFSEVVYKL